MIVGLMGTHLIEVQNKFYEFTFLTFNLKHHL